MAQMIITPRSLIFLALFVFEGNRECAACSPLLSRRSNSIYFQYTLSRCSPHATQNARNMFRQQLQQGQVNYNGPGPERGDIAEMLFSRRK
ncbi:hypothetical protein BDV98DRAFT_173832 [Pterulicium gracile]|uniref:Secreted protein n=1 Tax=Pterulicium gracile TaxID=1884261 RepID=A0A5C3QHF9_9AGAR|nr:hypothetical protein BDV98DRAFT_173832 [Pterula gracilis]